MDAPLRTLVIAASLFVPGLRGAEPPLQFLTAPGSKVLLKVVANAEGIRATARTPAERTFVLDLQSRAFGLLFGSDGSHVAVQPVLGASIAF